MLDTLRAMSIAVWFTVAVMRTPSILRVLRAKAQFYDVLWSLIASFAYLVCGFNARWFISGNTELLWAGLYSLSIGIAMAMIGVMIAYEKARPNAS